MSAARMGGQQRGPGDPSAEEIARAIHEFEASDRLLLSPAKMRPYSGKWVAAYNGGIVADTDLNRLVAVLHKRGIPLGMVAIRFIEQDGVAE